MTLTEIMLSAKLKEAEPTLDLLGADRKVLKIAYEDFKNYEKFLSFTSHKTIEGSESTQIKIFKCLDLHMAQEVETAI
jgi:hypothetical protein